MVWEDSCFVTQIYSPIDQVQPERIWVKALKCGIKPGP